MKEIKDEEMEEFILLKKTMDQMCTLMMIDGSMHEKCLKVQKVFGEVTAMLPRVMEQVEEIKKKAKNK